MKRIIPIVLAMTLVLGGCSSKTNDSNLNSVSEKSKTTNETSEDVFLMAGKVEAQEKVDLTSKISARVVQVMVDIGQKVNAGDPIVKLDTTDLQAQVNQAEAAVNTAMANLEKVRSGSRPEQIAQTQAALESAEKNLESAKNKYERTKSLFDAGAASKQELETAETGLKGAETQCNSSKEQLAMLNKGETNESINVLEAQVKQAQTSLETYKNQLNNAVICSPITGVVSAKNANIGDLASPSSVLVSIVNTDALMVNSYLPAGLLDQVKQDQELIIKVSEVKGKVFQGKVAVIDPVIDQKSKTVLVKVAINDEEHLLKAGMFAQIGIKK